MKSLLHYLYIGLCLSGIQTVSVWIAGKGHDIYPLWAVFIILMLAYATLFFLLDKILGKP